ncbi:hypothetical protein M9Y10_021256 [Tritrichomonas musculus]|uniref:At4g15545-like C-terminal domain-containing protein n=1 Tax=Tritrichomonas musculus TaxID=1915356 RepID=A0ABR2HDG5_9EUKA
MQLDAEDELSAAIDQVQRAATMVKQQRSIEAKMWQKRIQELSEENDLLQNQLADLQNENRQMKADLQSQSAEIESLRALNASLTRTLQSRDQDIQRFVSFNQNLKGLIDQQPIDSTPPLSTKVDINYSSLNNSSYQQQQQNSASFSAYSPNKTQKYSFNSPIKPSTTANQYSSNNYNYNNYSPSSSMRNNPSSTSSSSSKSSQFIKAAKEELTYSDFNQMINEIKLYNKHSQTRDETIKHVERLLCPTHRSLYEQFLPMISGI